MERRISLLAKSVSDKYDTVIAYSEGIAAQTAALIKCKKRLVWIHNDYAFDCARGDKGTDFKLFDKIICVSKATQLSFSKVFPSLTKRLATIYNIINSDFIIQSSQSFYPQEFDSQYYNIVSVGRISYQKNFNIIPEIIASLPNETRKKVRWYILGSGSSIETESLRSCISHNNVIDNCILLGARDNPYPYIKNANLFVLTSRYESYPTVINEALVLGTPIISIDIPPIHEMLDDNCIFSFDTISNAINKTINGLYSPVTVWDGVKNHNKDVLSQFEKIIS